MLYLMSSAFNLVNNSLTFKINKILKVAEKEKRMERLQKSTNIYQSQ